MDNKKQRTSIVMKVEGQNFTIIRQEYMVLCNKLFIEYKLTQSSRVGAALLNYFESRANASYDGKTIQYEAASIPYLNQCTMLIGSESAVKRCLNALVDTNYILKGEAVGITKFGYDNTKKYCLNVNKLNEWLIKYRDSISLPIIQVATPKVQLTEPKVQLTEPKVQLNRTPKPIEPNVTKDIKDKESIFNNMPQTEKKEVFAKQESTFTDNGNLKTNSNENNYIDFTYEKIKFGYLGKCKGLFQTYLNLLTFSEYEDKIIKGIFYSIKDNLTAYNKKQGTNTPIQDKNVLDALKIALQAFTIKPLEAGKMNLVYFRGSLNANVYIKIDDTAKLLSLASDEIKEKYYKIAARDGKEIANEILRKVLKHKI